MSQPMLTVEASRVIDAPPDAIYAVVRDYHEGHRRIVPTPYFQNWNVLRGGLGEGTEIEFDIEVYGQRTHYHQIISEPEPGRLLRETDVRGGQYSEFRLEPVGAGTQTRVTIFSALPLSAGLKGLLERWFQPGIVRGMFRQELENLARFVEAGRERAAAP